MSSDWPLARLGDYCQKIGSGATPRGGSSVYLDEGPVSLIRSQNVYNEGFKVGGLTYINEDAADKLKNVIVEADDVLLNITGDSVARVCLAPEQYLPARVNQHVAIIRPDPKEFDSRFIRYYLITPAMQSYLLALAGSGATRNALTKGMIEGLEIPKPDIIVQREIADVLSSLDDKIELNHKINQSLEEIAQAIFKSWFVDFEPVKAKVIAREKGGDKLAQTLAAQAILCGAINLQQLQDMQPNYRGLHHQLHPLITDRFPDQHGLDYWTPDTLQTLADAFPDELVESELGEIPKGWEWSTIGDEVEVVGGGTPSTKHSEFWVDGEVNWTSPKDLSGLQDKVLLKTEKKITKAGLAKISSGLLPVDTVLMSSRAPVGYLAMAKIPVAINQGYIAMKCTKRLPPEYVLLWADSVMEEIKQRASGSTFAEISKKSFRPIFVIVPDKFVLAEYSKHAATIFDKITETVLESDSLATIRDSLLPKLLSGEINLGDTQSTAEAVA